MFKRFRDDMKKYWKYAIYSSKAQLKSEIANSYLNWLWWILDPLCFMLIYVFMFGYVFKSKQQYFAVFVFIGITLWDFFNKSLIQSVKVIKANKPIVSKVYIPKFILILVKMGVNGFKMFISLLIIVAMLIVWRVPVTYNVIYIIPILMTLVVLVFGCCCFLLHYGVFVEDLSNVLNIALRFLFYLTGIFWNIMDRLPSPYNYYIGRCNPIAFLLTSARDCVIYGSTPHRKLLLLWFVIGLIISALGVRKIYKNENSYVKVI
ncbi:MAG: ABC transporter permease [Ruminococcus sp.]|nr:ABC transporter permease [Ruminococcus sp.]